MKREKEMGQALVETALVMPVFLVMLLAIFVFGQLFSMQQVVTNACREGARVGTLGQSIEGIKLTTQQYLSAANLAATPSVSVLGAGGGSGTQMTVQVSYPVALSLPVPGLPETIVLKAQTIMRIE